MPAHALTFTEKLRSPRMTHQQREQKIENGAGFGHVFTEHMITIRWSEEQGWHDAFLTPFHDLSLSPASTVFHYGQEIFEGMKAFRTAEDHILIFRPDANAKRFALSAHRLAMPPLPEEIFVEAVDRLVKIDQDWVPSKPGSSLYIRPFMIATEAALGVKPASSFLFVIIACPVGEYFSKDSGPVNVWIEQSTVRACHGGTGMAKCGGNYAGSLVAQREGAQHDCQQVLFLDAVEHKWLEEMGGMNIFFVKNDNTLITPPLNEGTILHGITRDSIITLAREAGLKIEERRYSLDELFADGKSGVIREAFACGTAAVIAPIGAFKSKQGNCIIHQGKMGELTQKLKQKLCDIQFGRAKDTHHWTHKIC